MAAARALLIDLDGVIRVWNPADDRCAERIGGLPHGTLTRAAFSPDLLLPAITGGMSDARWRERIVERLRSEFPGADAGRAVRAWSEGAGGVDPEVIALVRSVRRAGRVVLVTNATSRLPEDLRRLGIDGDFDAVVNSASVGVVKPRREIYATALASAAVPAGHALFVDDAPGNVVAARELGMAGHLYLGAVDLAQQLQAFGLLGEPVDRN